jgi:isocitrate dehydrogenase kinase/phosphatase
MFPHQLTDTRAFDVAQALLEGFNKHYRLFREASHDAKARFEAADWQGQQHAQRERIEFYDRRVDENVERLQREFDINSLSMDSWQQVKLHYIGLLTNHHQPELAETFFNSVTTKILHRAYFRNDFIFVRPAISTEYIENDEPASQPTYRAYYPSRDTLRDTLLRIVDNFQLHCEFEDLGRDIDQVMTVMRAHTGERRLRTNYQIQVLSSLFFRNKGAYVVGKIVNGFVETPFSLPILHTHGRRLVVDTALFGEDDMLLLFSFARAYFMVEMEIPSAYVQFLRSLMPRKSRSEIYNALGLHKQGKNIFYRDFLYHLRHSGDRFRVAPGIKGMVMLVFDLPSFPYVFKVIKDFFPPQKDTTREQIMAKYLLVKTHDRVGRNQRTQIILVLAVMLAEDGLAQMREPIGALSEIERNGFLLDVEGLHVLSKELERELDRMIKAIEGLAGGEFNINSPKQLGDGVRVVSMPCTERFLRQEQSYQDEVLPPTCRKRVAIEAGVTILWYRFVGLDGKVVGIDRFGLSGPGGKVMVELGMTSEKVVEAVKSLGA